MKYDALVAGAGIWGCTVARRIAEAGGKVLVLEARGAVGGNVRCETDPETGSDVPAVIPVVPADAETSSEGGTTRETPEPDADPQEQTFVLNTNTKPKNQQLSISRA
jgi:flavin-dependent dehydrogenase